MSDDEFDREAEREKLREKYEEDQADRAATERMSELLLQGATMTDRHCETCGDPIFQHEGQAFCPTCQAEVAEQGAGAASQGTADAGTAASPSTADDDGGGTPDQDSESANSAPGTARTDPGATGSASEAPAPGVDGNLGTAEPQSDPERLARDADDPRAALADAVTTLARDAATTDDPRRARDLLAAAREAAEALAALDA